MIILRQISTQIRTMFENQNLVLCGNALTALAVLAACQHNSVHWLIQRINQKI